MQVDVIEHLNTLPRLKQNWDAVYGADPHAQFFLSWTWLVPWIVSTGEQYLILAAKPDGADADYVAFFPLWLKTGFSPASGLTNNLGMPGYGVSDYTGFICDPAHEQAAIAAFATCIKAAHWTEFDLNFLSTSDARISLLLKQFPRHQFRTRTTTSAADADGMDNYICPYIDLPEDWETYLGGLSTNMRQKIRRFLNKVENSDEFRIEMPSGETLERDINILQDMWAATWGSSKGPHLNQMQAIRRRTLLQSFDTGTLFMPVLWHGDRPLGVAACLIDTAKRSLLFKVGGRDEAWKSPPSGLVLHAYCIRHAIQNRFTTYDFLRGNEAYKYSFGAKERRLTSILVGTRNGRNLHGGLEPRSLPRAFDLVGQLHRKRRLADAERGYRQILDVDPQHDSALRRLASLLHAKGDHDGADKLLKTGGGRPPNPRVKVAGSQSSKNNENLAIFR